jgi:hypothetical protein
LNHSKTCVSLLLALSLVACGSEDDSEPSHGEDPGEHACEHVSESGTAITAGDSTATAPALGIQDEPYTVTLTPQTAGYVKIQGPLVALLFTDTADVVNALTYEAETTDLLPQAAPNERCASEIPEHFDLDLDDSGSYYLTLGPAAVDHVWLTLTEADGHAH